MSSQSPSNSNGNNGGRSFVEPFGNRVLSLGEVDRLRRMTMMQNGQQQQQQQQQQQNRGGSQSSAQLPTSPFLVLTQVPVQATPFANFASNNNNTQGNSNTQSCMTQNSNHYNGIPQQQQQQQQQLQPREPSSYGNDSMPDDDNWVEMLQPTPLAPNHFQNGGGMPHRQQQFQHGMSQQQAPQLPQQNNNTPFDPSTMTFLQELMMNAATAALQQQQQQQIMQQNTNIGNNNNNNMMMMNDSSSNSRGSSVAPNNNSNFQNMSPQQQQLMMQSMTQALAGRIPVDTSVSPVPRPDHSDGCKNSSTSTEANGVQAWKQMWDSASKTMFQQQHQQLLQQTGCASQHNNMINSASFPIQPSKRKYAEFNKNSNSNVNDDVVLPNFNPLDDDDDDDDDDEYIDIDPTPLTEIRERERMCETMSQSSSQRQREQEPVNMAPAMPPQIISSPSQSQWPGFQQPKPLLQVQQQQPLELLKALKKAPAGPKQAFILPSTMMPPTVLTSTFTEQQAKNTNRKRRAGAKSARMESPQQTLERIAEERGYGVKLRIPADEAAYDAVPSPLQLASFGTEVVKAVHTSDAKRLGELLSSGLSPNPCNQFRDSIVDLVCKRANEEIFQCLLNHGSELRVCDGFGRTPLHHCCWASEFSAEIADSILKRDLLQLFIEDKRGQTPLEYVRSSLADSWVEFLEEHKEEYFPIGGCVPTLKNVKELRPDGNLPDPPNSLSVSLAGAVSSGQLTPEQVNQMDAEARAQYQQ
eukprot:scaffold34700_cov256-Amphora_coffeaeformis.AAC.1